MDEGLSIFLKNNHRNCSITSTVPDICKLEPCALGIDEAGRGPVLGPMVYGITYCPEDKVDELKKLGCADSKTLTEDQREKLFDKLDGNKIYIGWAVEILSPNFICNNMFKRNKCSLNEVSHNSAIGLIKQALCLNVQVTSVYVDTVGPPEKYQAKLSAIFPNIKITVSKKADSLFPVVSAASICAKVARDKALKQWSFREHICKQNGDGKFEKDQPDVLWGSGYPGDPVTKNFLAEHIDPVFGFPQLVRFSWSTSEQILKAKAVKVEWEDVEDTQGKLTSVKSFFTKQGVTKITKRHPYFVL